MSNVCVPTRQEQHGDEVLIFCDMCGDEPVAKMIFEGKRAPRLITLKRPLDHTHGGAVIADPPKVELDADVWGGLED